MEFDQLLEEAKKAVLESPQLYHQHAETLLKGLYGSREGLNSEHINKLTEELQNAEYPHHKLLLFYSLELLLVSNCSNYRTNKLSQLLNLIYATQMKQTYAGDFNSLLSGYILTVVHGVAVKAGKQFLPEVFRFILEVLARVSVKPPARYESVEFDEAVQKTLTEDINQEWVLLHGVLKLLQGLLISNSRYHRTEVVRVNIYAKLVNLSFAIRNEPLLAALANQIITSSSSPAEANEPELLQYQQLTPKFSIRAKRQESIKDLKKKRTKMEKRIANELRGKIHDRMQEQQIRDETRHQRIQKRYKKELYIVEKQTADARKIHRKVKRAKQASKEASGKKK